MSSYGRCPCQGWNQPTGSPYSNDVEWYLGTRALQLLEEKFQHTFALMSRRSEQGRDDIAAGNVHGILLACNPTGLVIQRRHWYIGICHCHLPWCQVHAHKVSLVREHAVSHEHIASVLQQNAVWKPDTYVTAGGACWCLRTTVFHLELVSSGAHTKHVGGIGGIGHHAYRFLVH